MTSPWIFHMAFVNDHKITTLKPRLNIYGLYIYIIILYYILYYILLYYIILYYIIYLWSIYGQVYAKCQRFSRGLPPVPFTIFTSRWSNGLRLGNGVHEWNRYKMEISWANNSLTWNVGLFWDTYPYEPSFQWGVSIFLLWNTQGD
jgi:hypothetical protein